MGQTEPVGPTRTPNRAHLTRGLHKAQELLMVSVPEVRSRTARCGAERMPIVSKRKGASHDRRSVL
jgi:hypothetical protein